MFTAGRPRAHDGLLENLDLERTEGAFGSFLTVDELGRTSSPRVWAAGNVVDAMANVPVAVGAGSMTGAAVNMALVAEEFDAAAAAARTDARA